MGLSDRHSEHVLPPSLPRDQPKSPACAARIPWSIAPAVGPQSKADPWVLCSTCATAWPAGDLGLRKAVEHFLGAVDVREVAVRFHPFQNLSAHYLLVGLRVP